MEGTLTERERERERGHAYREREKERARLQREREREKERVRLQRILEVLSPEKRALITVLPFFYFSGDSTSIFPGIVLPFCYFSVVWKVMEKPVLFLPHP
jgi:hypothetical protein